MKLGWCAPLRDAGMIRDAGFDYIELPLAAQDFAAKIESPLPVGAFNYFFPQDMRIVGPEVDDARLDDYLARAAALMASVNARAAVMGSAWARNVPDGFERARAEEQIVRALDRCADRLQRERRHARDRAALPQGVEHHQQRRGGRVHSRGG